MAVSRNGISVALLFTVFFSINVQVVSQFDKSVIQNIIGNLSVKDKLLFIAQFLLDNYDYYKDLEDTLLAFLPLLDYDKPHGNFVGKVLPWGLHNMPNLLENCVFRGVSKVFIKELNAHNDSNDWFLRSGNISQDLDFYISNLLCVLDFNRMGADILQMNNMTGLLQFNYTASHLNDRCLKDILMLLDRLLHGDELAHGENATSFKSHGKKCIDECGTCTAWMVVGIVGILLSVAFGMYATFITCLWRKTLSKVACKQSSCKTAQTGKK